MDRPDRSDDMDGASKPQWYADEVIDVGHGCFLGLVMDDGCYVVLYPQEDGGWKPGTHIPRQVAHRISELVKAMEGVSMQSRLPS